MVAMTATPTPTRARQMVAVVPIANTSKHMVMRPLR